MGENPNAVPDAEAERRQLLDEMEAEHGSDWQRRNEPGSFGCHELLDRTNLVADFAEKSVLNHPACISNPEWFALANQAVEALRELYQKVGQDHLDESSVPPSSLAASESVAAGA